MWSVLLFSASGWGMLSDHVRFELKRRHYVGSVTLFFVSVLHSWIGTVLLRSWAMRSNRVQVLVGHAR
jgi:hypothetical protein